MLVVSSGPKQTAVPNVVGMSQSQAENSLSSAGFRVTVSQVVTTPANVGKVVTQSPNAGSLVNDGSTVTITVGAPASTTTSSSTTTTT